MNASRLALALSVVAVLLAGAAFWETRSIASLAENAAADPGSEALAGYVPGLGEIMTAVQMRHAKLGVAGQRGNWPLADYELDELDEGLIDALTLHPTHKDIKQPLTDSIPAFMKTPIDTLRAAVKAKDAAKFMAAYDELTAGCNGCHQATEFGFNVVTRPNAVPVPNQDFAPAP